MAFPGTLNINYYKGDTYEFRVYPKDSSGAPFDLSGYSNNNIKFTISTKLGTAGIPDQKNGFVEKSEDGTHILCAITPEIGNDLIPGTSYVYDIEIGLPGSLYNKIFTLLAGRISVADQVTQPYELEV
jgi:hypothetical protein